MNKLYLLLLLSITIVLPLISAIELNPFAVTKIVEKSVKADMPEFLKTDFNSDYGVIRLSKTLFWIPTDKVAEYSLTSNTERCYLNCEAKGKAVLYTDGSLFEDINFKDTKNRLYEMDKYQFWLFGGYETKTREVCAKYDESTGVKGEEFLVEPKCLEYAKEEYQSEIWNAYNYEPLKAGDYQWKLTGSKKSMEDSVDWLATSNGKVLTEWAYWLQANANVVYIGGSDGIIYKYLIDDKSLLSQSENYGAEIYTGVMDNDYIYYAGSAGSNKTYKAYKSNLSKIAESSVLGGYIYMMYQDVDYIYCGGQDRYVYKLYKSNLSQAAKSIDLGGIIRGLEIVNNTVYSSTLSINLIRKLYVSNLSNYANYSVDNPPNYMTKDDTFLYYGTNLNFYREFLNLSNRTQITGTPNVMSILVDDKYAFFSDNKSLSRVYKNNLSNELNYTYGEDIYQIAADNNYVYFGGLNNKGMYKSYKSNLSKIDEIAYTGNIRLLLIDNVSYAPMITLNSPADTYNSSSASVLFNVTVTSIEGITNVSLYLNGVLNETNTSGINATSYLFTKSLSDGNHNWSITSCNTDGCTTSATRTFTIDTTAPVLNVTSPYPNGYLYNYHRLNTTLQINFTAIDTNRDKCWYNYNGTNYTITCSDEKFNVNITNISDKDVTVYANDTFGNLASLTRNWDYKLVENSRTYDSTVFDTATANYGVNVTANSSLTGVSLDFNGTTYSLSNQGGGIWNYSRQIPTSEIGNNSITFRYQYDSGTIDGFTSYQTVSSTVFALCNSTYSTRFVNMTFKDENSLVNINATIPTASFIYYLGNGTINKTLTYSSVTENYNYSFCGTSGGSPLKVYPTIQYKQGTTYPQRIWSPDVQTYNSTLTTQVLYLLNSVDGLYVTFQVIDNSDATISGVEVVGTRVIDGVNTTLAVGTTDSSGLVTFWLNPDFYHTFTFVKEGYNNFTTSLFPTQTSYTITLGSSSSTPVGETTGISYGIKPTDNFLTYYTIQDFEFTIGSSYWELDEFGFDLNWSNGTLIGSNSSTTSSGGTISIQDLNVSNASSIVMTPYYTVDSVKYTLNKRFWYLQSSEGREFSLYQWFSDFTTYTSTGTPVLGFNDFGKLLLTALVLILLVGGLSQRYGLQSESAITGIIFSVIFFLEYTLEWIPLITTPLGTLPRGTITIVSAIILIATMIAGERR